MQRFVHLSDPHLTPLAHVPARALLGKRALGYLSWHRRRKHRHLPHLLARVTDDAHAAAPEHYAVTGDLTQIGLPQEHALALDWLQGLATPDHLSLAPGNHDFYAPDAAPSLYARWRAYLPGPDAWPLRQDRGDISFITLNSGTPCGAAFATGTLGAPQLARLPALLRATTGRFRVLLVHHSPLRQGHPWRKRLTDAAALRAILAAEGVELVLHGHAHEARLEWLHTEDRCIPVVGAPSASLRSSDASHRAGYQRIDVRASATGWDVALTTRQCVGDVLQTTAEHDLSLPAR